MKRKGKVFVGMSGGVDSSVAAFLLKKQGYDVVGVFMKCWTSSNTRINADFNADKRGNFSYECEAESDAEDARRVAGKLGIPFYVWNFEEEYKKKVVDYMVDGYRRGLTPNPDVMCNKEIKFGLFLEKALKFGADYVATGHYVRLKSFPASPYSLSKRENNSSFPKGGGRRPEDFALYTAKDSDKDQSYFLWTLTQEQLRHCLFPLGDLIKKTNVRRLAKKYKLPTAEKKDSQGICFLGKVSLADFLKDYIPARKGTVLNVAGEIIGEHSGAQFYTIGQRHGLASGDWKRTPGVSKPFYVSEKNARKNTIIVAEGEEDISLFRKEVELSDINFINPETHSFIRSNERMKVLARVRYRQPLFKATVEQAKRSNKRSDRTFKLIFDKPQKFVAAGQSAVFYSKSGEMLGGGVII